jgi:hypothetical protein
MPKASRANSTGVPVAHPPAGAAAPGSSANSPTPRRSLLAGAAAVLAAAPFAAHAAQLRTVGALARDTGADPVLDLYQRWRAVEAASDAAEGRLAITRTSLTKQGVRRLIEECDRLNGESFDILETVTATPATSQAGALAKLRMAAEIWPRTRPLEEFEFHEGVAHDAILDAARLFGGALA